MNKLDFNRHRGLQAQAAAVSDLYLITVLGVIVMIIIGGYFYYTGDSPDGDKKASSNDEDTGSVTDDSDQGTTKVFRITAEQWKFEPSSITVNKGDRVKLVFTSPDVPHGFALQEFNVNEYISGNGETTAEFTADETGTFTFFCSVHCGAGHGDMVGTLIVN